MKIEFTDLARADLIENQRHGLLNFGQAAAENYSARIEKLLGLIALNPSMGVLRTDTIRPVRTYPVGAHVIVYEVLNRSIRLTRILHGHQNWRDHI
jgi:plasmid stabilization system protein ParE